jgi:WD40 repeat protein
VPTGSRPLRSRRLRPERPTRVVRCFVKAEGDTTFQQASTTEGIGVRYIIAPLFLILALELPSGCEPLEIASCAIPCTVTCPDDMRCREGRCVSADFPGTCEPDQTTSTPFDGGSGGQAAGGGGGQAVGGGGGQAVGGSGGQAAVPDGGAGLGSLDASGEAGTSSIAPPFGKGIVNPALTGGGVCRSNGLEIQPCPLPAPCLGEAYDVQLTVTGGTAPYVWAASASEGLSVSTTGRVIGVAQASGELAVHMSDAAGLTLEQTLSFEPRRSCWFAYTAAEASTQGSVELFDPILSAGLPERGLKLPRDLPAGERALDFQFSPDGHFLAVRVMDLSGVSRLELFEAPGWREREFLSSAPGNIQGYAWSPDSSALAMTTREGASDFLTGVRVSSGPEGASTITPLPAVPFPVPVDSAPLWFGADRVAFHGQWLDADPDSSRIYHTRLTANGFEVIATRIGSYSQSSLRLTARGEGFFAVVQFMDLPAVVDFLYPIPGGLAFTPHASDVALAPSSGHVARAIPPNQLVVTRGSEDQPSEDGLGLRTLAVAQGCEFLLAWSSQSERLACVTSGEPGGSIRIFDLDAPSGSLDSPGIVEGTYSYDEISASLRRRAFSTTGRWFAFSTGPELFVVDVSRERYLVDTPARFTPPGSDVAELSFSPDERQLLQHQGNTLWLHTLEPASEPATVSLLLPGTPGCSEVGSAINWCGTTGETAGLMWSADSRAAAYRTSTADALVLSRSGAGQPLMIGCGAGVGAYAFQP